MGGNAFKNFELVRVRREDVPATVRHVVHELDFPGFTDEYAFKSLMGSTGKKESSGDVDFCMNTKSARFYGEPDLPVFNKHEVLVRIKEVLPEERVNTQTFKMGNLMTAFPVAGDESNGLVQVDFVFGKHEWLMFSHFSPSEEESRFPGVFLSQGFGVLAKMHKDFESTDPSNGERTGRVGLHFGLEEGMFRKWESRRRPGMGCSKTTADEFETRFAEAPRFTRIGHVDCPQAVVDMLLPGMKLEEVRSFENLVEAVRRVHPDRFQEFYERFCATVKTSGMMKRATPEAVRNDPVWKK